MGNRNNPDTVLHVGDKFNEWTIIEIINNRKVKCVCSCGKQGIVGSYDLRHGKSKSCGHITKGYGKNGRKELEGTQIGEWSIGKYIGDGLYECKCSCGVIRNMKGTYLRTGQSKSCGHSTNAFQDLTNQKFNEWTALKFMGDYKWLCRCSCGVEKIVGTYDLKNNKSTNCGHLNTVVDLRGKSFGKLIATEYIGKNQWLCQCACGKQTIGLTTNLVSGNKKSCGCLQEENKLNRLNEIKHAINEFIASNGELPFKEDLAIACNLSTVTINKYINEFELTNSLNKSYGSRYERDIHSLLSQYVDIELHNRKIIEPLELDMYIPKKNLAIEFNGSYWHSELRIDRKYHQNKTIDCAKQGIRLVHIFEYEWNDPDKHDKLERFLINLVLDNKNVIYARNTNIKAIYNTEETKEFLNKYHLQDYSQSSIDIGLYYDNELVSVMTFGTPRFNTNYQYELIRYCTKEGTSIVGGANKLYKYFIETYNPKSVITYSDISKFTGNIYLKLGFKPIQPNPITEPNYAWVNMEDNMYLTRYQTQKSKLVQLKLGTEQQSETEIMTSLGYDKVYDSGNIKLEWNQ